MLFNCCNSFAKYSLRLIIQNVTGLFFIWVFTQVSVVFCVSSDQSILNLKNHLIQRFPKRQIFWKDENKKTRKIFTAVQIRFYTKTKQNFRKHLKKIKFQKISNKTNKERKNFFSFKNLIFNIFNIRSLYSEKIIIKSG